MKTKGQKAAALYASGRDSVRQGGNSLDMLASHIAVIVNGNKEYPGPLWREREWPDGKIVLDSFKDYLLKPSREGLGVPSLLWLSRVLNAHEKKCEREAAFKAVRQEIPDFDEIVAAEEIAAVPKSKKKGAPEGNQNASKDKNKDADGNIVSRKTKGSNKAEYIIARLKRDAETDPKAKALLDTLEAGGISARAAALEMGWIKLPDPAAVVEKQMEKLPVDAQVKVWREWGRSLPDGSVERLDVAQEAFLNLTPQEQQKFLTWASSQVPEIQMVST